MEGHRYDDSKTVSKRSSGKIILSQNKLYGNYTGSSHRTTGCRSKKALIAVRNITLHYVKEKVQYALDHKLYPGHLRGKCEKCQGENN